MSLSCPVRVWLMYQDFYKCVHFCIQPNRFFMFTFFFGLAPCLTPPIQPLFSFLFSSSSHLSRQSSIYVPEPTYCYYGAAWVFERKLLLGIDNRVMALNSLEVNILHTSTLVLEDSFCCALASGHQAIEKATNSASVTLCIIEFLVFYDTEWILYAKLIWFMRFLIQSWVSRCSVSSPLFSKIYKGKFLLSCRAFDL